VAEQEGVIKYKLDFSLQPLVVDDAILRDVNAARDAMCREGLIGVDAARYGGLGFGNLSLRCAAPDQGELLISGSQTGHLAELTASDVACVTGSDSKRNLLHAKGLTVPSSESMTHAVLYQSDASIDAIIHVHSPDIWYHGAALGLPATASEIVYGTPQMARAVALLASDARRGKMPMTFTMRGHQDGVIAAGENLAQCVVALRQLLKRARELD
jgi:ribulose-5-phosphate 4-epimerase/fuculose-1-phosphate aldolase